MRQYKEPAGGKIYSGFSKYDADAPILAITTFDENLDPCLDLWSMDDPTGLPNLLQLYLDDYGHEPEDVKMYELYTKTNEIYILRSDGCFVSIQVDSYDNKTLYFFESKLVAATKFEPVQAIEHLKRLRADYSNDKFTLVSF